VGVTLVHHAVQFGRHAVGIAEHLMIPEADQPISFPFDPSGALCFAGFFVLTPVHLDHEPEAMAAEIRRVGEERHLAPEAGVGETFPQDPPHPPLRIRHVSAKAAGSCGRTDTWAGSEHGAFPPSPPPPQPSPIKGEGVLGRP
jgi:hypothetical protein